MDDAATNGETHDVPTADGPCRTCGSVVAYVIPGSGGATFPWCAGCKTYLPTVDVGEWMWARNQTDDIREAWLLERDAIVRARTPVIDPAAGPGRSITPRPDAVRIPAPLESL